MTMDRAIFDLKAGVEATSLYLLICSFLDGGVSPNLSDIRSRWAGSEESLRASLEELSRYGIVEIKLPMEEGDTVDVTPSWKWRRG